MTIDTHPTGDLQTAEPVILDSGQAGIRPRARLLRTIGAELISSELVAAIELIRNCYDADAKHVSMRFIKPEVPSAAMLEIEDDGHGMSRGILLGPWLEPATNFKTDSGSDDFSGQRSPAGRRRLGSKGVGRFAAQRLGAHLEVVTCTARADHDLVAVFDWERLDRADQYIEDLAIPWQARADRQIKSHGTLLRITNLHDRWDADRFEKLKLALSRLVGPGFENDTFDIDVVINGSAERVKPAVDEIQAMYSLQGKVSHEEGRGGVASFTYTDVFGAESELLKRPVQWPETGEVCGPIKFRINSWDLDRDALGSFLERTGSPLGLRDFRKLVRDNSGISLYRDGFRILPYGEPGNDWLELDRRRVNNPTLRMSNNQILGQIQLSADDNLLLRDQTNREGLVTNDAYQHLRTMVLQILGSLEQRRFKARRANGLGSNRDTTTLPGLITTHSEKVNNALEAVQKEGAGTEAIETLRKTIDSQQDAAADTVRQYAGLAAAGQLSGLVFAQLSHPTRQILTEVENIRSELLSMRANKELLGDLGISLDKIKTVTELIRRRIERVDPLAATRMGRRKVRFDLGACLHDVMGVFNPACAEFNIHTEHEVCRQEAVSDPTVASQVAATILENAIYWLSQQSESTRILRIEMDENGFTIENTGPDIPNELHETIFDAHVTGKGEAAGMGLTLAQDLMKTVGGWVQLEQHTSPVRFRVHFKRM